MPNTIVTEVPEAGYLIVKCYNTNQPIQCSGMVAVKIEWYSKHVVYLCEDCQKAHNSVQLKKELRELGWPLLGAVGLIAIFIVLMLFGAAR